MSAVARSRRVHCTRLGAVIVLAGSLSACTVGPDYRTPASVSPDAWHGLPGDGVRVESPDAPSLAAWWEALDDPMLSELIERALAENKTVKQALARVVEARARRGVATADFWPTIGASAFAERNLKAQSEVLDITRWRAEAGLVSVLDCAARGGGGRQPGGSAAWAS